MKVTSERIKVGDALEKIPRQPKVMKTAYEGSGDIPVIDQGRDYCAGYVNDPDLRYNGSLPLTVFGDHTRILKWVDKRFAVGADGTQLLRADERFDQRFFYYALKSVKLEHFGYERHFKYLKDEEIPIPDLPTQRKIAGILSAYDDLIENNLRRIKILEQMAQSLYREWFVHFRFPGHESVKFKDSELGRIPDDWEVKTIADLCQSVSYGFTASASRENIGPRFLRITDIVPDQIDWANVPFCDIPKDKTTKLLLLPGDIVIARTGATTGYAKRLNKLHPATVFASYLVRARTKVEVSNRMLGILMESDEYKKFIQTNLSGSAQPQANAVVLTSMPFVAPDRAISERFDQIVEPIIDQAELLSVKNQNLRRTRDLLLPKLLMTHDV